MLNFSIMKCSIIQKIQSARKQLALGFLLSCSALAANAQSGTYEKKASLGAYGIISLQKIGKEVTAEIFTWWNTKSGQMGSYYGKGLMENNRVVLRSEENDPSCVVTLHIVDGKVKAVFENCNTDHLTTDFSGLYTKITNAVAGDYQVKVPKAYFYRTPHEGSTLKTYVLKGDKVRLDIDRIGASKQDWVYVYFVNKAGKETAGFLRMAELSRVE